MKNNDKNKYIIYLLTFLLGFITMFIINNLFDNKNDLKVYEKTFLSNSVKKAYDSTVVVENYKNNQKNGTGSGFVYKKDNKYGYVITNEHVIKDSEEIIITMSNDKKVEGTLLGKDEYLDLAIVAIPRNEVIKVATIGKSEELNLGDTIFTIGTPIEYEYRGSVTSGIVSGKDRMVETKNNDSGWLMRVIQIDASINPGNSGGPLLNISGEVVGICTLKLVDNQIEGMGFAIPIEYAINHLNDLESGKEIEWPKIGINIVNTDESRILSNNDITIPENIREGAVVTNIKENSTASSLKKGDIIIKVNKYEIKDTLHLKYYVYQYKKGEHIKITYLRNNKEYSTKIKLQ